MNDLAAKSAKGAKKGEAWPMVRLGDVCEVILGGTPSTKVSEYWGGDIAWLTPGDMGKLEGMFVTETSRKITEEGLRKGTTLFPVSSVIVSVIS